MFLDLGLETLSNHDTIDDTSSDFELGCQFTESRILLDNAITSLENCIAVQDHLERFGSSEALKDLAGKAWEGAKSAGKSIAKAVKWLYDKVVAFFKWLGSLVARLCSKERKKETEERADGLMKFKDIPVDDSKPSEEASNEVYDHEQLRNSIKTMIYEYGIDGLRRSSHNVSFTGVPLSEIPSESFIKNATQSVIKELLDDSITWGSSKYEEFENKYELNEKMLDAITKCSVSAKELAKYVQTVLKTLNILRWTLDNDLFGCEESVKNTIKRYGEKRYWSNPDMKPLIDRKLNQLRRLSFVSTYVGRWVGILEYSLRNADFAAQRLVTYRHRMQRNNQKYHSSKQS